ncbi:transposase [Nannocystis sp. RBIL2]|uniref:transposase n=1 Tax=Nannocystis sp. RBIL2 TaxID=2996788 RepID=UPI00226E0798|nr:transposase [Nannocystis sp. RBIL2]MCY1071168.1 transposase [Nannocystis sp. RBIL2]
MAMGHDNGEQPTLFITYDKLQGLGHPFYEALDKLLRKHGFDRFAEKQCQQFYAEVMGRPGLAPGVYFRCLLIGYFEGIGSERGIAWRIADSLSLRRFLGLGLEKQPPDHSTISRTRRRLSTDVHERVFTRVLELVAEHGLLRGKTLGIDATTLEANAALRSIVRRDDGRAYKEYLTDLAEAEGIEEPTREDLARLDRKRPKKGSNDEWVHPHDPEAQIMKMKNGSTHLAHKHEQAVDLETGAIVGVTVHGGAAGDTKTLEKTLEVADANLAEVRQEGSEKAREQIAERVEEVVADKGYHSNDVMTSLEGVDVRSYIPEPARGRRRWEGKQAERDAVRRNRRRMKRSKGKELQKKRSELVERPFAHMLDSGGMRRVHVRGHDNILKRLVIHAAGFNLSLIMRMVHGIGKPKALQGLRAALSAVIVAVLTLLRWLRALFGRGSQQIPTKARPPERFAYPRLA